MNRADSHHWAQLSQRCSQRGLELSVPQLDRLMTYLNLLLQWRRHLNLTGLREAEQLIDVLIVESLDFLQGDVLPRPARVLDLGTGAGVPGVALAVCEPRLQLTFLDRSQKKMTFLRRVAAYLDLRDSHFETASAQEFARRLAPEAGFDAVVSRGVGTIAHLLSLAAPLLRPGGVLVLRKPSDTSELQEAESVLASDVWSEVRTLPLPRSDSSEWNLLGFVKM